ncbi:MAG TPA: glycoside hydrolase family 15 protein [Polyangiaceae bacterium]|jgi:GH15 family glucan-1,4-alpha-glucosidase|nr:glycoside hydrolase family 15 protein [Polyangiaceae bacterium]
MALRIEDYALLGDCEGAALVGRDGSMDWLTLPRFDSGACFASLLGKEDNGRWLLAPAKNARPAGRRYREGTMVLETDLAGDGGKVRVIDFMPPADGRGDVVRIVEGLEGEVVMRMELVIRFDYGSIVPWVRRTDRGISAVAGPDALLLDADVECHGEDLRTVAEFSLRKGERRHFALTWFHSATEPPPLVNAEAALIETEGFWREWSSRSTYHGLHEKAVLRSLLTLKALTYAPTGGIIAAPTTSLPESIGGERNWDYRCCWLRDATFVLYSLLNAGFVEEARSWRYWLTRAVAGSPSELRIMYGLGGERRLTELELPWLAGYEGSKPVRIGNAASEQHQLDVYGEVLDSLHLARKHGADVDENTWRVEAALVNFLEKDWTNPDEGIWEVRGPRQHFTHSKVMAWVAVDRAVKAVEQFGCKGPVDRWRALRDAIHRDVCEKGYDAKLGSFVQSYGSNKFDASLLMIPLVGFLPSTDPRVEGTVNAIERHLTHDGFVLRYDTGTRVDGLSSGEGVFLTCSFWLADNLKLLGRNEEAKALFERLLAISNDVGLLAEEYDPVAKRMLGNFPQAFSHVGLINTAHNLMEKPAAPAQDRADAAPVSGPRSE